MNAPDVSFLRSLILMVNFKGESVNAVAAALPLIGLRGEDFTAASLPREITQGDIHVSGAATRMLLTMGLVEKVGYIPSPNKDAKGRPVCLLRIPANKVTTARVWLQRHGISATPTEQLSLAV